MLKESVLILSPFFRPNIGGVETHLDDLCKYLRIHDYKVYVVTYQPLTTKAKRLKIEKKENLEIRRFPWFGLNWFHKFEPYPIIQFIYLTPRLLIGSFLFMLTHQKDIDVIHAHGFNSAFIARVLKLFFKKKVIVSTHAIYGWLYNINSNSLLVKLMRWILTGADSILAISKQSRDELIKIGVNLKNITIYRHWVDQTLFKPLNRDEAKKRLGWNRRFVVLFVGRFIKIKGADVLLKMAKQVTEDIYFAFIGDGPLADEIRRASDEIPNVLFIGKVNNQDLPLYYNAADIVCIPSQYEEGFGKVILEAISCGTPVVGSNKGGIPEAVDESVGILVEPAMENLKDAIEELYSNREKLKMLSSNCRKYAEEGFSERNAEAIVESYYE